VSAQRKIVTIVFTDVVGSTSLGESVDQEVLRRVMSAYFDRMRAVLERHGGTVEKYIGDAIMAVFGVPELHEDDALRAVRAAAEMRTELDALNDELDRRWGVRVEARTGVNTGEVLTDERSTEIPLTADAANVAARLEQAAATDEVLIGEATYRLVKDAVDVESVGPIELKGKARPLPVWRLLGASGAAAGIARRLDSPIVGRDAELRRLREELERSTAQRGCRLVTVFGEPGLGKSRLAAEFVDWSEGRARVLRGRCLPYGEGITFWPVSEVLRQAMGAGEEEAPGEVVGRLRNLLGAQEEGAQVAEYLGSVLGLTETGTGAQETFWSVRRLFETLAGREPLVVVFDDIHWGEPTFLDLVEYVAGWSSGAPILLLCLSRPELLDARPNWAAAVENAASVRLEPLTEDDSERLVDNLLGPAPLDDETRARIRHAAEGNPLFVEEILRMLVDDGLLHRDDGRWVASGELSSIEIPPTINALLAARLERLTAEERAVIERAACVGKIFWWRAVSELSPEPERTGVGAHLQALVRKELVRPDRSTFPGEDAFRFSHILIRDAAYRGTTKEVRAEAHARFSDWLERRAGERVAEYDEIIGYHLEQAHRYGAELGVEDERTRELAGRAARHLGTAGTRAFRRSDIPAAINLLSRATELLDAGDPERVELLPALADAFGEAAQPERSREVIRDATAAATALGDDRLIAYVDVTRWHELLFRGVGDPQEGRASAEQAARVFERAGDERGLARAWRLSGQTHWQDAHAALAEEALERSLRHARAAGDPREEAEAYYVLSSCLVQGPRPLREASERAEQILTEQWANRGIVASMCHTLGHLRAWEGRFSDARAFSRRYSDILRENGQISAFADSMEVVADIELCAGDPAEAAAALQLARDELEAAGAIKLAEFDHVMAEACYLLGRFEDAERYATLAIEKGHPLFRAFGSAVMAKLRARTGDAGAEDLAREASAAYEETDFLNFRGRLLAELAEVLRLLGRNDDAAPVFRRAIEMYEAKGATVLVQQTRRRAAEAG